MVEYTIKKCALCPRHLTIPDSVTTLYHGCEIFYYGNIEAIVHEKYGALCPKCFEAYQHDRLEEVFTSAESTEEPTLDLKKLQEMFKQVEHLPEVVNAVVTSYRNEGAIKTAVAESHPDVNQPLVGKIEVLVHKRIKDDEAFQFRDVFHARTFINLLESIENSAYEGLETATNDTLYQIHKASIENAEDLIKHVMEPVFPESE